MPLSMDGKRARHTYWIDRTDVDSSGRGAGDGRAVYEGPQAPEAFHRRFREADSRPLQRRKAQARDHGRAEVNAARGGREDGLRVRLDAGVHGIPAGALHRSRTSNGIERHRCGQEFELTLDSLSPMDDRASSP